MTSSLSFRILMLYVMSCLITHSLIISAECPPGVPMPMCSEDVCLNKICPAHPTAVCKMNFCGGCFHDFFLAGKKVNCDIVAKEEYPSTVRGPTSNPVQHVSTTNSSHASSESVQPTDVLIESEPKSETIWIKISSALSLHEWIGVSLILLGAFMLCVVYICRKRKVRMGLFGYKKIGKEFLVWDENEMDDEVLLFETSGATF